MVWASASRSAGLQDCRIDRGGGRERAGKGREELGLVHLDQVFVRAEMKSNLIYQRCSLQTPNTWISDTDKGRAKQHRHDG